MGELEKLDHDAIDALRVAALKLAPAEQYRLAVFIAENVGYVLAREPDHPDCPHTRPSPSFKDGVEAAAKYLSSHAEDSRYAGEIFKAAFLYDLCARIRALSHEGKGGAERNSTHEA